MPAVFLAAPASSHGSGGWVVAIVVLVVIVLVVRWVRSARDEEVREDPTPRRLLTETSKLLGVATTRTVEAPVLDPKGRPVLDAKTGQAKTQEVKEPVSPAEHWELGEDGRWRLHGWNPDTFRASDPNARAKLEAAAAYALGCAARKEQIRGHWNEYGRAELEIIPAPILPSYAPARLILDHAASLPVTVIPFGVTDTGELSAPLDEHSRLAVIDVKQAPHVLVTGATGSRKTSTVRAIIAAALRKRHAGRRPWEVVVLNGKGGKDWVSLEGVEGVRCVLTSKEQIIDTVIKLAAEAQRRYDDDEQAAKTGRVLERSRVLIAFDERMDVSDTIIDAKRRQAFQVAYASILRKARGAGMHVLDITQRADIAGNAGKAFSGEARDNLPGRLALGFHREDASVMTLDDPKLGQTIEAVPGRGIYKVGTVFEHVQCIALADPLDEDAPLEARRETQRVLPGAEHGRVKA